MDGARIGAIVSVAFGCAWGVAGATGLRGPLRTWVGALCIVISFVLITLLTISRSHHQMGTFRGQVYGIAVGFEAVAIFGAIWLLRRFTRTQFVLPATGFIVGLHFLGLWKATDLELFVWVALGMCSVCAFAVFTPGPFQDAHPDYRQVLAGLGCALVLWAAGVATLH